MEQLAASFFLGLSFYPENSCVMLKTKRNVAELAKYLSSQLNDLTMGPEVFASQQAKSMDQTWVPVKGKGEFEPYSPSNANKVNSLN